MRWNVREGGERCQRKRSTPLGLFGSPKPQISKANCCVCVRSSRGAFSLEGGAPSSSSLLLRYEAISHFYCPPLHASLRKNLFHRRLSGRPSLHRGRRRRRGAFLLLPSFPLPPSPSGRKGRRGGRGRKRQAATGGEEKKRRRNVTVQPVKLSACQARCSASTNRKGGGGRRHVSLACVWRRRRRIQEDLSSLPASPQSNGGGPLLLLLTPLSLLRSKWEKPCSC